VYFVLVDILRANTGGVEFFAHLMAALFIYYFVTDGIHAALDRAFEAAKDMGLLTVGLAGSDGGAMATSEAIDHLFVVPSPSVHRFQETQTTLYHVLRELTAAALAQPQPQPAPG
jgi:D-sedoheptulose 7-phosphate isomerase